MTLKTPRVYTTIYQKLQGRKCDGTNDTIKVKGGKMESGVCRRFKTNFYQFLIPPLSR